ncbi:ankyrin repeat-containing domain protein [Podospora didyma]|uniref:Ankyrin repeat-containing domain protein n=1 Tax=Podospora didyma TaxID=330526 RepID=A0AAE0U3R3_9PEZI|nr:ankyrin repeat-containing domain protein [Podospora didyma]
MATDARCSGVYSAIKSLSVSLSQVTIPFTSRTEALAALLQITSRPEIKLLSERLAPRSDLPRFSTTPLAEKLHYAIDRRDNDAVLKLLEYEQVNPNILRSGSSLTPLHRAFFVDLLDTAVYLVLAGANLEARNKNGETAIIRAVRSGFPDDFILLLCEQGAATNAVDFAGRTALHYAAEMSPEDNTILALYGYGADMGLRDRDGRNSLLQAVGSLRITSTRQLLSCGVALEATTDHGKSALELAITQGSTDIVKLLCDGGAALDVHIRESTPLLVAITSFCTDIARVLVEAGANPDLPSKGGCFPLIMASALGYEEVVEMLLACKADIHASSPSGNTPLHMAVQKNHIGIVQRLIGAQVSLNRANNDGYTPLELAVVAGHDSVVQLLLDQGASPNSSSNGQSVLWRSLENVRACSSRGAAAGQECETSHGHTHIICLLIKAGADVTKQEGREGITPLHLAARLGLNEVLELMLPLAAKGVETRIWAGHTPLFFAAEGGHIKTVKLLIDKYGADVFARTTADEHLLWAAAPHYQLLRYFLEMKGGGRRKSSGTAIRSQLNRSRILGTSRPAFDVNHRSHTGATVLHISASAGSSESTKLLLRRGATEFLANAVFNSLADQMEGNTYCQGTPSGLARQKGHTKIAAMIEGW